MPYKARHLLPGDPGGKLSAGRLRQRPRRGAVRGRAVHRRHGLPALAHRAPVALGVGQPRRDDGGARAPRVRNQDRLDRLMAPRYVMRDPETGTMLTAADVIPQIDWIRIGKGGDGRVVPAFFTHPGCTPALRRQWGMRWEGDELITPDWWPR